MNTTKQTASETQMSELLAFHLFRMRNMKETEEAAAELWRNSKEARDSNRASAKELLRQLEEVGVRIAASNSQKVLKAVNVLVTIPARPAYSLEGGETTQTPSI